MTSNSTFRFASHALAGFAALALAGCASLGGAGPSTGSIRDAEAQDYAASGIQVIELGPGVVRQLSEHSASTSFAQVFGESATSPTLVGAGDLLDISIFEAPPAVLFSSGATSDRPGANLDAAGRAEIPRQQVDEDGRVSVPFVGRIDVAGLRPQQIEAIIVSKTFTPNQQGDASGGAVDVRLQVADDRATIEVEDREGFRKSL